MEAIVKATLVIIAINAIALYLGII